MRGSDYVWRVLGACILVLMFVVIYLAAMSVKALISNREVVHGGAGARETRGARAPKKRASQHVVVDTLNLAHWLSEKPLSVSEIIATIDETAPALKKQFSGRVMYVLKDRESRLTSEAAHRAYQDCAERNRVYVIIAEKYADPPSGNARTAAHSARGRDDFLVSVLADRWRCLALTEDRLRDFREFRQTLQPFHAYEFAYWRDRPAREYFRPESVAYSRLRKPRTASFSEYL